MSILVSNKRRMDHMDTPEDVRKRIKCTASPLCMDSLQRQQQVFQERVHRLQRIFPVDSSLIISTLESCNQSADPYKDALESLQRLQAMEQQGRGVKRSLNETFEASASSLDHDDYADRLVRSLHGCPSIEEARNRVKAAFSACEADHKAQQQKLEKDNQSLQQNNRVLLRTMQIMNEKHREMKQTVDGVDNLRNQLQEAQEQLRKAEQMNKVLQWHISQHRSNDDPGSFGSSGVF